MANPNQMSGLEWQSLCNLLKLVIIFAHDTLGSQEPSHYDIFLAPLFVCDNIISMAGEKRRAATLTLFLLWIPVLMIPLLFSCVGVEADF